MTFRRNVIANYFSNIYVTAIGILIVPMYIKYMGAEAYGLVGFFAMLQALFSLLDMGLTPTVARESARFNGGATSALDYRRLVRALEGVFFSVAIIGTLILLMLATPIASNWLNAILLPQSEIIPSLQLMAITIGLRWMCGLYRGVISGAERLVWLGGFNVFLATVRFVLVIPVLIFVGNTPLIFFFYQLGVAALELVGLFVMAYRIMPTIPIGEKIRWEWTPLKPVLKFSLSIAFISSVWVFVTQSDKLVLSKILPLADYGYFTIVVLVASGVMVVAGPISSAIIPRMARLHAEGKNEELISVYRQSTQLISITAIPFALVIIFFSPQLLWAWTGDAALVHRAALTLSLYAIGYSFLVVGAFPYYLQYAKGDLRLHLVGSVLFLVLLIPSAVWSASHYGMVGAGWAWLVSNMLYFIFWTPLVHFKFFPGLHFGWLFADIARPIILPLFAATLATQYISWNNLRIPLVFELIAAGVILFLLSLPLAGRVKIIK